MCDKNSCNQEKESLPFIAFWVHQGIVSKPFWVHQGVGYNPFIAPNNKKRNLTKILLSTWLLNSHMEPYVKSEGKGRSLPCQQSKGSVDMYLFAHFTS